MGCASGWRKRTHERPFTSQELDSFSLFQVLPALFCAAFGNGEIPPELIGRYLAIQLECAGEAVHAATLREWATESNGMFAQAWVSCTGQEATTSWANVTPDVGLRYGHEPLS